MKTERLSRQLKAQAESILEKSGVELAQGLLETCGALLRLAEEAADPGQLEAFDQDMLTDGYQTVAQRVSTYIKRAGLESEGSEALTQGSAETLEERKRKRAQLAMEDQQRSQEIQDLNRQIADLNNSIEDKKRDEASLAVTKAGLEDSLAEYTPERLAKLQAENRRLFEEVTRARAEFEEKDAQRADQEQQLRELQEQIDALPQTLKDLRGEMDRLEAERKRIQEAEETCSEEKQAQARTEIEALAKQLEEDRAAFEELSRHLDELRRSKTEYDAEAEQLSTDAIALMNSSIRALRPKLEKHRLALERIREENAQLEESYRGCLEMRKRYEEWFTNDRTPLERLMDALKEEGSLNLKGTLNLSNCERVRAAFERIRADLDYLDGVLTRAAQAYGQDLQKLRERSLGKTPR